jgi:iron complex transport system permease protein
LAGGAVSVPWVVFRPRRLPLSVRVDRRAPLVLPALALALLAALVVDVGVGEYPVSPVDVLRTVVGQPTADPEHPFIVTTLRLPRALVAAAVGTALALSGAAMQGLTRNPLASPELTGVTAGAGLAAFVAIVARPGTPSAVVSLAAFGGAVAAALLVGVLGWGRGEAPLRLVLVGIGLTSVAGALTTLLLTYGEIEDVTRALVWLTGSVHGSGWDEVRTILPWLALGAPAALLLAPRLDALALGEAVARGLGVRVGLQRALLLLVAAALAAAAVTVAGTVAFVGLIAPHVARRLVGPGHVGLLPAAALAGALIVVLADLVGRTAAAPAEIPCGIVTAAIGAPFFLALLYRGRAR